MKLNDLCKSIEIMKSNGLGDMPVVIQVHQPGGIGGTPCVHVKGFHAGFDWDNGKLIIYPEDQLTKLSPDDVKAITESVVKGQSWHAYQQHKKMSADVADAKRQVEQLKSVLKQALPIISQFSHSLLNGFMNPRTGKVDDEDIASELAHMEKIMSDATALIGNERGNQ